MNNQSNELKRTFNRVKKFIESEFELDGELFFKNRTFEYIKARQFFVAYLFNNLAKFYPKRYFTYSGIGQFMNRDHATVIHNLKQYHNLIYADKIYREESRGLFYKIDCAINLKTTGDYTSKEILNGSLELIDEIQAEKMLGVLTDNDCIILTDIIDFLNSKKNITINE